MRAASVTGIVLMTLGMALYPEPVVGEVTLTKPVVAGPLARLLVAVAVPLVLAGVGGALTSLAVRLRRSSQLTRRQVVVLLVAAALLALDVALQGVLAWPVDVLTQAVAVALVPVGIGVAVTRHRLYDLDLAVCRAIGGPSLAVCLAGVYCPPLPPRVAAARRRDRRCQRPPLRRAGCSCTRSAYGSTGGWTGCSTATAPTRPCPGGPRPGLREGSTSARCPPGSASSSWSRCGSARPRSCSARTRTRRRRPSVRRTARSPSSRCATEARSSAHCGHRAAGGAVPR